MKDIRKWLTVLLVCVLYLLIIIVDYQVRGKANQIYYTIVFVSSIALGISTISTLEAKHEWEKKKLELQMEEVYGDAYKELILDLRRRQHDFMNQLTAIYSMHITATTLEELIEAQRKYGDVILRKDRHDKILLGCSNPVLAGYLYYKCVAYERNDVEVDYQIQVNEGVCRMSLHETIEILGILLTNAFENYSREEEDKRIRLVLRENSDNLTIEVGNKAKVLTAKEIEKMLRDGYSTKGESRGFGLGRVKQLTTEKKAQLIVENQLKENINWVNFKVVIPK